MTSKKLGALLQSVPPATARPIPEISPAEPMSRPEPITRRMTPAAFAREEPEVPLQVLIPAHIRVRRFLGEAGYGEPIWDTGPPGAQKCGQAADRR